MIQGCRESDPEQALDDGGGLPGVATARELDIEARSKEGETIKERACTDCVMDIGGRDVAGDG